MEPAFHSLRVPPTATDPAMGLLETISQHPESIFTAGLAFIVLLSIPHVRQLIVVQPGKEYPGLVITSTNSSDEYVLTYSSKAVHQRIVLAVVAAIATLSVLTGTAWMTSQILQLAAWSVILFQECILVTRSRCQDRYLLGCYSAIACLVEGAVASFINALGWIQGAAGPSKLDGILTWVQISAAFILTLTNLSIPRAPNAYRDGKLVDRRESVCFLSRYTFWWATETMVQAAKTKQLNADDLPVVGHEERAQTLYDHFASRPATNVLRKFLQIYSSRLLSVFVLQVFDCACRFLPQVLLFKILRLFEQRDAGASNQLQLWLMAAALGGSMVLSSWLRSLVDGISDLKLSLPIHQQLFAVITSKILRLKDTVVVGSTTDGKTMDPEEGEEEDKDNDDDDDDDDDGGGGGPPRTRNSILNLLGVDADKISNFANSSHTMLDCALDLTLGILFLTKILGWRPVLAGCGIPILLSPVYYCIMKRYTETEETLMKSRDKKSAVLTEAVRGIRQIKFSSTERQWSDKIIKLRQIELSHQHAVFWFSLAMVAIWSFGPVCMSIMSLLVYVLVNHKITASTAFTAVSIFQGLQLTLSILPELLTELSDAAVSAHRVEKFLELQERGDDRLPGDTISFRKATITWPTEKSEEEGFEEDTFCLKGLCLDFPTGKLSVVSGRTGSGKTLLLQSIIGEAKVVEGSLTVPRRADDELNTDFNRQNWIDSELVAYVSQDPWIENATIRESILFGLPFDAERYSEVLNACALRDDLKALTDGDMTEVGANGINLSGGQKWRVAFARALYSRAGILILDDIFSAVDVHVGRHLYEKALTGKICHERTRILVTHHVPLCLDGTEYLVVLANGRVLEAGHPLALTQRGCFDTAQNMSEQLHGNAKVQVAEIQKADQLTTSFKGETAPAPRRFYEDEKRATGSVKGEVYKTYMKACGGYVHWIFVLLVSCLTVALSVAVPFWISIWTREYQSSPAHADNRLVFYVSVLVGLSLLSFVLEIARYRFIYRGSIRASRVLFERFTNTVTRMPLHFFDTTPAGRILNRFTSDFGTLDSDVADGLAFLLQSGVLVLSSIGAALVSLPLIMGPGFLSLVASCSVAWFYIAGARETKRLERTARSPVYEQVGSLLSGLPTVRAFRMEERYLQRLYALIDEHCQARWHQDLYGCWMSFWLSMVGASFVTAIAVVFVVVKSFDAPIAGFALGFALELSGNMYWFLHQYTHLELDFNAAERIVEYTELQQEPQSGVDVPARWPDKGSIEIDNLTVSYAADLPPVLKGVSFTVRANERIGIVGRTGAGKSSLALALLRLIQPQSGTIWMDGVDISKMRLHDLRSRVMIIPQDPVVFSGTVREVLDPFDEYDEGELQDALNKAIGEGEGESFLRLSSRISEGGRNLSQGQRQLLCLARAMVRRPRIMIMDEATASVDMESDARIQRTIRAEMQGCTLVVIAHRVSTVADFDRILVLDEGRAVEFDTPAALMRIEGGIFRGLSGV